MSDFLENPNKIVFSVYASSVLMQLFKKQRDAVGITLFDENISMLSMAFYQVLLVSGPILALALGIGLFIGIIQAATSINEMTLSFVPKVIIVILTIAVFSNYLIIGLTDYFMYIFEKNYSEVYSFFNNANDKYGLEFLMSGTGSCFFTPWMRNKSAKLFLENCLLYTSDAADE